MAHWHTTRQGESVPSIAERYGFRDWRLIYDHGKNKSFRDERPDPNVLYPGDQIFIPSKEPKYVECVVEQVHKFSLNRRKEHVHVILEDDDGNLFANMDYVLTVGDQEFRGNTGPEAVVDHEVRANASEGLLKVWYDPNDEEAVLEWVLEIGYLDPVDTVSGMQARLNNLGIDCGPEDGEFGDRTRDALAAFQRKMGLDQTGEFDDETRNKLADASRS